MAMPYWWATEEDECGTCPHRMPPRRKRGELAGQSAVDTLPTDWAGAAAEAVAAACSAHASLRRAQRSLRIDQLVYVLTYGEQVYRTGATFHILRRCDIDPGDLVSDDIAHLEGAVVLVKGNTVVTVYRHRKSYRRICRKQTYVRHRELAWEEQWGDRHAA
jgi:hypothetical protein